MAQTLQSLLKSKRVNKKRIQSALNQEVNRLDAEKRSVFDNMRHDFLAHLSDRQSELEERQRKAVTAIRQQFQSLLMQIPSNIQNLTIGEMAAKGGSVGVTDGPNGTKQISLVIPKDTIGAVHHLPQVTAHKDRSHVLKEQSLRRMAVRNTSSRKTVEKSNNSRIVTRSALKTTVTKQMTIVREHSVNTKSQIPTAISDRPVTRREAVLKALNVPKQPRRAEPNEEVVTLPFSTTGTPLVVDGDKTVGRIGKN